MKTFIDSDSILYKIWGTTDITLFIFAGASAEFALNKQVDWLYFTGKLPADPIARLFSTVSYAQQIIFAKSSRAEYTISRINDIHGKVESNRGRQIPARAYKDVLFLLIHYSITAFELLERKLSVAEKDEIVAGFSRIGELMHLEYLPTTYAAWSGIYAEHLNTNLEYSHLSRDLFDRYRKHLGAFRYFLLKEVQKALVPPQVKKWLKYRSSLFLKIVLPIYRIIRKTNARNHLILLLVPDRFHADVRSMDNKNLQPNHEVFAQHIRA